MMVAKRYRHLVTGIVLTSFFSIGCHRDEASDQSTSASTTASTQPATAPAGGAPAPVAMVDYSDKGCHFQYPNNWKPITDKEYELHLLPAQGPASRNITFDIPDLPPHFPGMITLNRIQNGYTDDLKKKHADAHVDSTVDHPMPGNTKARIVQTTWKQGDTTHTDVALLIMHNDAVYILTADADAAALTATRADFDKVVASLRWDK